MHCTVPVLYSTLLYFTLHQLTALLCNARSILPWNLIGLFYANFHSHSTAQLSHQLWHNKMSYSFWWLFLTPLCAPLLCRYEVVASAKLLGGFSFAYTVRGDRASKAQQLTPIPGIMQRKALHMVHFMYPLWPHAINHSIIRPFIYSFIHSCMTIIVTLLSVAP